MNQRPLFRLPRIWLVPLAASLLLTGCALHTDRAGNYNNYSLNTPQAAQVAQNIAGELVTRYPARTVFYFPHDKSSSFAASLEQAIHQAGRGVSGEDSPGLHHLSYRLARLNTHQFVTVVTVNRDHFQTVWSDDDQILSRLYTVTQYGGAYE